MVEVVSSLMDTIKEAAREEAKLAGNALLSKIEEQGVPAGEGANGGDVVAALNDRAAELFASQSWRKELNAVIEGAFQTVLPQLVKRFRKEIEQQVSKIPAGAEGEAAAAAPADIDSIIGSVEMKEMIDEKFRHMLMYLKQEVIPKAVRMANDQSAEPKEGLRDAAE